MSTRSRRKPLRKSPWIHNTNWWAIIRPFRAGIENPLHAWFNTSEMRGTNVLALCPLCHDIVMLARRVLLKFISNTRLLTYKTRSGVPKPRFIGHFLGNSLIKSLETRRGVQKSNISNAYELNMEAGMS